MKKIKLKRILIYLAGLYILSFGIDLMIIAGKGTGAWDAINVGLSKHFGLSIGTWAQIVGIILIFIIAIIRKSRPEILPLLTMFLIGNFIDLNLIWLIKIELINDFYAYLTMGTGLILMSFGIALYLQAKFGFIPIDGFVMLIHEKSGWSLRMSKTSAELGALVLAFLLGGTIGVGTILVTFLIGPMLQFFYKIMEKRLKYV